MRAVTGAWTGAIPGAAVIYFTKGNSQGNYPCDNCKWDRSRVPFSSTSHLTDAVEEVRNRESRPE